MKNMKSILKLIKYTNFKWKVYADIKVINMLNGFQGALTLSFFLCMWNSGVTDKYYI